MGEDHASLFAAHIINKGCQSTSIKSYISVIKFVLLRDGYDWKDSQIMVSSLTRACKLVNDRVKSHLPIHYGLLELILFEVDRFYHGSQPYLQSMYKALFALGYYGMLRAGELTMGPHIIQVKDMHSAVNKEKILLILYLSKMHDVGSQPQVIYIVPNKYLKKKKKKIPHFLKRRNFCAFRLLNEYISRRGCNIASKSEQFFIFRDKSPVTPEHVRHLLAQLISNLSIDSSLYDLHSLHISRT